MSILRQDHAFVRNYGNDHLLCKIFYEVDIVVIFFFCDEQVRQMN